MSKITQYVQRWTFTFDPEVDNAEGLYRHRVHRLTVNVYQDEETGDWPYVSIDAYGIPLNKNGEVDKRCKVGLCKADLRWQDRKARELAKEHKLFYLLGLLIHNQ